MRYADPLRCCVRHPAQSRSGSSTLSEGAPSAGDSSSLVYRRPGGVARPVPCPCTATPTVLFLFRSSRGTRQPPIPCVQQSRYIHRKDIASCKRECAHRVTDPSSPL